MYLGTCTDVGKITCLILLSPTMALAGRMNEFSFFFFFHSFTK